MYIQCTNKVKDVLKQCVHTMYQQSKRCYKTMCTLYIQCTNKVKDVIKQCVHCTYNVPTK